MLRTLARDIVVYLLPLLVSRGLGLLLLPVYTRYLTPRDYGLIELLALIYTLLNLTLPLELSQAVARFTPEARTPAERSAYFSTAFWFTAACFVAVAVVAGTAPAALAGILLGASELTQILPLAALAMLCNALLYLVENQQRWNLQPFAYAATHLIFSVCLATISIVLIALFDAGVMGFVWGQLVASVLALAFGLYVIKDQSPLRFSFQYSRFREMLTFSSPLVLSSMAVYLSSYLDRWIVGTWTGVEGMGVYSVAARIASVVAMCAAGVQLALMPHIYRQYREPSTPQLLGTALQLYLWLLSGVTLLIGGFAEEVVRVLAGAGFSEASSVVGLLCLGGLVTSLAMFAPGLPIEKKTGLIALANLAGAATSAILGVALTYWFGLRGAATATLLAAAVSLSIYYRFGQRYYPVPYRWVRLSVGLLVLLALITVFSSAHLGLGWRLALVVAGLATLTATMLADTERRMLVDQLSRIRTLAGAR